MVSRIHMPPRQFFLLNRTGARALKKVANVLQHCGISMDSHGHALRSDATTCADHRLVR